MRIAAFIAAALILGTLTACSGGAQSNQAVCHIVVTFRDGSSTEINVGTLADCSPLLSSVRGELSGDAFFYEGMPTVAVTHQMPPQGSVAHCQGTAKTMDGSTHLAVVDALPGMQSTAQDVCLSLGFSPGIAG